MKRRLIGGVEFGASKFLRSGLAIAVVLFFSGVCRAQQAIPLQNPPARQDGPRELVMPGTPIPAGAAIDSLALKLSAEILALHMTGVVVVGLSGPDRRITELGTRLRGVLSDSLARESAGVKVPDGDAIRDFLKANHIAEDMVYSNALGGWIAKHMRADGYVTARINMLFGNAPTIVAELFVCTTGVCVDSVTTKASLVFTPEELQAADEDYVPTLKIPVVPQAVDGVSRPKCVSCPMPAVPPELRIENVQGSSRLLVTVLPDGTADDVFVVGPMGHGLDTLAVDAVLTWKFSPARDSKDVPVATQTELEIPFKIEGVPVPVKKVQKKLS
jgi:TonB family protein